MRRLLLLALCLCAAATPSLAATDHQLLAHGARDGKAPAWAIDVASPAGWTRDCCTYAQAIGVNAVLYQGDWTGKPQRVMVLNVWPRKLPTLAAEVQADRKHYLQADPAAKVTAITVHNPAMRCAATLYQGTDHVDDAVVFCDPGKASGIRLSWSISFDDSDPTQGALLDDFMQVVVAARYRQDHDAPARSTAAAASPPPQPPPQPSSP